VTELNWHYGPTAADPDPGSMWHYGCGGRVYAFKEGHVCSKCADGDDAEEANQGEPDAPV
jgi:hypothetical protein